MGSYLAIAKEVLAELYSSALFGFIEYSLHLSHLFSLVDRFWESSSSYDYNEQDSLVSYMHASSPLISFLSS